MCKKQTSVSHSSTEAEFFLLTQPYGWTVSQLWCFGIWFYKVFHCSQNQPSKTEDSSAHGNLWHRVTSSTRKKNQTEAPTKHDSSELFHIDNVPSNIIFSQSVAMLYVFEHNEAVIKMIVNGRSPTMRHVSRTNRVSLDWLFDRINLDPKIQIRYKDTKHQMADILTKGHFTRDEWTNLLCLFNISCFSSLCCAKNFSLFSCTERMAKMMQEQSEENRIVARSGRTAMNLTSSVATRSSSVNSPIVSRCPGILKASRRQVGLSGRLDASTYQNSSPDAASSSQGCQRDAQMFISTRKPVASEYQGCSENPEIPEDSEDSGPQRSNPHLSSISPDCVPHKEKVFSIIRKSYDRKPTDDLRDLDVNTAVWGFLFDCYS